MTKRISEYEEMAIELAFNLYISYRVTLPLTLDSFLCVLSADVTDKEKSKSTQLNISKLRFLSFGI